MESFGMSAFIRPAVPEETRAIESNLHAFNVSQIGPIEVQPLSLVAIEGGQLSGGVIARTSVGWLQVDMLWVTEDRRGFGIGRALLAAAEAEARIRGCRGSLLDTFDWQAEPFYLKQGYEVFGRLKGCPSPGRVRTFMSKVLDEQASRR
jgi:GNAT superfamily N-acetyltransferase